MLRKLFHRPDSLASLLAAQDADRLPAPAHDRSRVDVPAAAQEGLLPVAPGEAQHGRVHESAAAVVDDLRARAAPMHESVERAAGLARLLRDEIEFNVAKYTSGNHLDGKKLELDRATVRVLRLAIRNARQPGKDGREKCLRSLEHLYGGKPRPAQLQIHWMDQPRTHRFFGPEQCRELTLELRRLHILAPVSARESKAAPSAVARVLSEEEQIKLAIERSLADQAAAAGEQRPGKQAPGGPDEG